jgi:spermidine synthase
MCLSCVSDSAEGALRRPARLPDAALQSQLRFYNPALHLAAFALPEFARRKLEEARVKGGFAPRDTSLLH